MADKNKIHTVYRNSRGEKVPSVTTVLGMLSKPALVHWAWNLGIQGIDYKKVRDEAASIGTLAHHMCECYLKGIVVGEETLSQYPQSDITKAKNAHEAFVEYWINNNITLLSSEKAIVSDRYNFGGTIDICAEYGNGDFGLLDLKTSKGVFPEMRCQVAAYKLLLEDSGVQVDRVVLLRIDKETAEFHIHPIMELKEETELFLHLLKAYPLKNVVWNRREQ